MQNKSNLGDFLKQLRIERGDTLEAIESATGLSRSYVNRLENKSRHNPTLDSISRLIKYYKIPFSTIEEFCDCGNSFEGQVKNLDFILLNESYRFANIEVDLDFKMTIRDLIQELENYATKASVCRADEAIIIDKVVVLREKLLKG